MAPATRSPAATPPETRSLAELLASLPAPTRRTILSDLTEAEANELLYDWHFWARPSQLPPPGDWSVWLLLAGRGFGKTRIGAEWVRAGVCGSTPLGRGRYRRVALVAETAADGRLVMVEGESGLMAVHAAAERPCYEPSKRLLTWPNGAIATLYNATEPDQLRGPQHDAAWCDELAKWRYARETWDMLQFGLRLGPRPRQVVTTTPRPLPLLAEIMRRPDAVVTRGSTHENRANLPPSFFDAILARYEGTRLGRQELHAEWLEDLPGALWQRARIDALRLNAAPELARIVVAIDPAVSSGEGADETGIVVAGLGLDGHGYVLEDASMKGSPDAWGRAAVGCFRRWQADRVIGEVNNGGELIEHVLRTVDQAVPYKAVRASRGKRARAEPIAALDEQGRVHHVGAFAELEDQMCQFTSDFDAARAGFSPDRVDARVWALSELMLSAAAGEPRVRTL